MDRQNNGSGRDSDLANEDRTYSMDHLMGMEYRRADYGEANGGVRSTSVPEQNSRFRMMLPSAAGRTAYRVPLMERDPVSSRSMSK